MIYLTIKFELWFGFVFTFLNLIIMDLLVSGYNNLIKDSLKIPEKILKKSKRQAGLYSYAVWSIQLLILGLTNLFFFPLYLYFIYSGIYIIMFIVFVKKNSRRTLMESFQKIDDNLKNNKVSQENLENGRKSSKVILDVKGLSTYFYTEDGIVRAVENTSFQIYEKEIMGLVGETGCGKSVTALSILQLIRYPGKIVSGEILFDGKNLAKMTKAEIRKYRGSQITMMFQDPLNSLNPVFKVGDQLFEVYRLHKEDELLAELKIRQEKLDDLRIQIKRAETDDEKEKLSHQINNIKKTLNLFSIAKEWAIDLITKLGIADADKIIDRYPFELSGGMRQRIMIAMGLLCRPKLLLADEPTTALDVTIQEQILELLRGLTKSFGTSILMITHDLGIITELCDRVAIMYAGSIVESGPIISVFKNPKHPYTIGLMNSIPKVGKRKELLDTIRGTVPNLIYPPSGCRFHPRCPYCFEPCDTQFPELIEIEPDHFVACHLFNPIFLDLVKGKEKIR